VGIYTLLRVTHDWFRWILLTLGFRFFVCSDILRTHLGYSNCWDRRPGVAGSAQPSAFFIALCIQAKEHPVGASNPTLGLPYSFILRNGRPSLLQPKHSSIRLRIR
jgi:hypothetical protein